MQMIAKLSALHIFLHIKCVNTIIFQFYKGKGLDSHTSPPQQPWNPAFSKDPGPHSERINNGHIISILKERMITIA